jgi:hypothetical protein
MGSDLVPFTIAVPDAVLDDLRDRLARTRWPDQIPGTTCSPTACHFSHSALSSCVATNTVVVTHAQAIFTMKQKMLGLSSVCAAP